MKYKGIDLTGQKFTRLTVISLSETSHIQADYWNCVCDCGNELILLTRQLIKGNVKSCGCLVKDSIVAVGKNNKKHGLRNTRQYYIWRGLKVRCGNSNSPIWENYGKRGITYDPKWENFEGFWEDMGEGYSDDLTLDRIDPNGNYTKENCRWANKYVQAINKNTPINNTSGVTGVHWNKDSKKWRVRISVDGCRLCLGEYADLEEAVRIRKEAEMEYFGETFGNDL